MGTILLRTGWDVGFKMNFRNYHHSSSRHEIYRCKWVGFGPDPPSRQQPSYCRLLCVAGAQNKSLSYSRTVFDHGVVLDLRTPLGKMCESCISMALADFYTAHTNYTTKPWASLDMCHAVLTGILSSRWRGLRAHTQSLDFDESRHYGINEYTDIRPFYLFHRDDFLNFVEHSLVLHLSCKIHKFRLCFGFRNEYNRYIDGWVLFAVRREVKQLYLEFPFYHGGQLRVAFMAIQMWELDFALSESMRCCGP